MISVVVVEDSPVVLELIVYILASDPEIHVVGTARNGEEAVEAVRRKRPDAVTMDIHMPVMDGLTATRIIMETCPTPIVIVSSSISTLVERSFRAVEAGALAVANKPEGMSSPHFETSARELVQTVKTMSEVKMVRRWPHARRPAGRRPPGPPAVTGADEVEVVAMGASTGGPLAIQKILSGLGADFPVPLLVVQHMAAGFMDGFAEWLTNSTGFPVRVAVHGERTLEGNAYVAPAGLNMGMGIGKRIELSEGGGGNAPCPSVSFLFDSVASAAGRRSVGVLLTGMGRDGAAGLKSMKDSGALTIAQDRESSVVYGMPFEALKLDAATYVLGLDRIADTLSSLVKVRR